MDFEKIKSIEYDKNENKIFGIKSAILWAHTDKGTYPLVYISKPRHMSREDFKDVLDKLIINVKK